MLLIHMTQQKEIILSGKKIAYFMQEKGNSPLYVFLHGWGSNAQSFHPFFSRTENFFAFDFPGHGKSSPLKKSWTLEDFSQITKELLEKKLQGKKIIFVVHSFGGRVLLKMLSQNHSFYIEQIIYTGVPFVRQKTIATKGILAFGNALKECARVLPKGMRVNAKKMWYVCLPNLDYKNLKTEEEKQTFQNIISKDLSPYFSVLNQYKSFFLWGENDDMAPLELVKPLAEKYNIPLKIISNAGHFPFIGEYEKEFFEKFQEVVEASIYRAQKRTP